MTIPTLFFVDAASHRFASSSVGETPLPQYPPRSWLTQDPTDCVQGDEAAAACLSCLPRLLVCRRPGRKILPPGPPVQGGGDLPLTPSLDHSDVVPGLFRGCSGAVLVVARKKTERMSATPPPKLFTPDSRNRVIGKRSSDISISAFGICGQL